MSLWIKICANTSLEDALWAMEAGADALGFVFAPSPRQITVSQVAAITRHLPASIEKIGVFVDATLDEIEIAVSAGGLTGVQLHFDVEHETVAGLRHQFGPKLHILRVVHYGPEAAKQAGVFAADANVDSLLVDSRTATVVGGTGLTFDWHAASGSVFQNANFRQRRLVAAGGLNQDNVAEAISAMRPWGVDVASGVEAAPGRKDPSKVATFIANARASSIRREPPK